VGPRGAVSVGASVHDGVLPAARGMRGTLRRNVDDFPARGGEDIQHVRQRLRAELPSTDVAEDAEGPRVLVERTLQESGGVDLALGLEVFLGLGQDDLGGLLVHSAQHPDHDGVISQRANILHEVALAHRNRTVEISLVRSHLSDRERLEVQVEDLPVETAGHLALLPKSLEGVEPRAAPEVYDARIFVHEVVRQPPRAELEPIPQRLTGQAAAQESI